MTSRTLKLLTASTAFVAIAASTQAATLVSGTSTLIVTDPVNTVTNNAIISTGSSPTIIISGTGSSTFNVGTGALVSAQSGDALTLGTNGSNVSGTVHINNQGTIFGVNAINFVATQTTNQPVVTISNTGGIGGSINVSSSRIFYESNNGSLVGNISSTSSAGNSVKLTNGSTLIGNVALGAGTNTFNMNNSIVSGSYVGGAGADNLSIQNNSRFTGDISLGAGADTLNIDSSRINGNITTSAGSSVISLTNAIVSGTITGAAGTDTLNIGGTNTFNTLGEITNMNNINFLTNTNVNHEINSAVNLNISSDKTVNAHKTIQASGILTNNGTLNIDASKFVNASSYSGASTGVLGIAVDSSNTSNGSGRLVLATSGIGSGVSTTINMGRNAGYIVSGTQYTIITGSAASQNVSLTNANSGVYRFTTAVSNTNNVVLNVGRVSTSSVVTGKTHQAIADVVDSLGTNADMQSVHSLIGQQTTSGGVNTVVQSLMPGIDGAGAASVNVTMDTGNQISNRLAYVRGLSGVATGDPMSTRHTWIQGFGSTVTQDDTAEASGYDSTSGGLSVGMDSDNIINGLTTGMALSYSKGSVDSNSPNNASTDINSYIATLYASRVMDSGVFLNAQVGAGYNEYDIQRNIGLGDITGSTSGLQGTAKLETGRDIPIGYATLTPLASVQYTYLQMDSYTESGTGGLTVDPDPMSTIDAGLGAQLSYAIPLMSGGTLKPSIHAKYMYRMGDESLQTTSTFNAGGAAFTAEGVKSDKGSVNVGGGLLLSTFNGTDLSVNYDADIRSSLIGHTGQLKARWAF